MPKYAYSGTTLDGAPVKGTEKASSRADAELALYERELRDLKVTEKTSFLQMEITGPRITKAEVMHMSRQMAAFLRAGLPILDAVHSIGAESENSSVRRMMNDIEDGLRTGERFSDCLERHQKVFPSYYRGIVRSAELTGELDTVLARLALYLERDLEARRKIKSALTYPIVIAAMSCVTVVVLAVYVLPKFKAFFSDLNADLPLPTRMLLGFTDFLGDYWWALAGGAALLVLAGWTVLRFERGRYARDAFLLKVPVLGETIQYSLVERFCRVLGSMVGAGVNLPEALVVTIESLQNRVYAKRLGEVGEAMLEGQGIATPLARTQLFPGAATQMLRVGEETGSLDSQLEVTAAYYEVELDYKIKKLTAIFEPMVIVVMGLIVGFVAVALVSAMYGIFNQVDV
ncbi:type II secretion system F family protein [Nocardioides marmoriginsengisoli]|uniref:Type II secretion system F family protein n=1 Tax=Nocardioides marmoriginsengisoli TaxID=661483 RepID=A0A3N0CHA8_9ACTN|nr:type II secretion system F family protein [Nocardioides marmoriginsengisoli]RNL62393.1 type II secretion system F family protein [Nocardioides marmoriginsengisoli]